MADLRIFIVEDDLWMGELLKHHLSLNPDYKINLFQTAKECLDHLHLKPSVVCIDFGLPDMDGTQLLNRLKSVSPELPVIVISGQEDIAVAVNFLKQGAYDYIMKGDHTREMLWNTLLKIGENEGLKEEVETLRGQLEHKYSFQNSIIGESEALKKTFQLIEKACSSEINVSITGETGTGKEVVAKAIHFGSTRKKKPFVAVNMAAIPAELIESELFGYEKGAFTGAQNRKIGKFEEAKGGTIFLDEIAELDLSLQSKILRVLQEREIVRVGGNERIKTDVRLITATHKDLTEQVKLNKFREDLYYRIIGLPVHLPPLRNRGNDILLLARYFADEYARQNNTKHIRISSGARDVLMKYSFPGNVRELKAVIDLACVMSDGKEIRPEDIQFTGVRNDELFTVTEKTMKEYTSDIIAYFLKKYNNNVVEVAKKLDMGKSTIYNMIKNNEIKTH